MFFLGIMQAWIHFLEFAPCRVFLVELTSVIGEEKEGEDCEEDAPEGTPETDVIKESSEADSVVDDEWGKLHVEGNCVLFGVIVGHYWDFLEDGLDLKTLSVLSCPSNEIIRQNFILNDLIVDCNSLIVARNDKEVVEQVVITVRWSSLKGNWRIIPLIFDE